MSDPIKNPENSVEMHLHALEDFVAEFGKFRACGIGNKCHVCARDMASTERAHEAITFLRERVTHLEMLKMVYERPQVLRGEDFAEFRGVLAATFFHAVAAELDKLEAANFITFQVASGENVSPYWCTVRRDRGQTPEEQNRELRAELETLRQERDALLENKGVT